MRILETNIYNQLNEGIIVVDEEGTIQFCNTSVLTHLGYNQKEVEGRLIDEILILSDNDQALEKALRYDQRDWKLITRRRKVLHVNGKITVQKWYSKPAYWIIISEYTVYTKKTLEDILENVPYGIAIQEFKGRYQYVSQNFVNLYNRLFNRDIDKEQMLNMGQKDIWTKEVNEKYIYYDDELLEKERIINEDREIEVDGKRHVYNMHKVAVLNEVGEIQCVLHIIKYIIHQSDIDNILIRELYNPTKKTEKITEIYDEQILGVLGANSLLTCEYDKDKGVLTGLCRLSGKPGKLLDQFQIQITQEQLMNLSQQKTEWELDEICRLINIEVRIDLKLMSINYIYAHPIVYNDEILGVLIATYNNKLDSIGMENQILRKLSGYVASTMKNNQLSNSLMDELYKRKQAEEELRSLLDIATGFVCVCNQKGYLLKGNVEWWQNLGWELDELFDQSVKDMRQITYSKHLVEEDREISLKVMKELYLEREQREEAVFTNRWKCKNGSCKWIRWQVRYSKESEKYFITGTDITEIIQIKNERLLYQETLQLEALKSQFLANISHELRTPLNIIYSILQLMDQDAVMIDDEIDSTDNMKAQRYREMAKQNVLRLLRLVDNIMDISEIKAGSFEERKENYNIIEIIENATMAARDYIENRGLELIFDTQEEEVVMACNRDMIERIIFNLLSNAIKYSDEGSIVVNIEVKGMKLIVSVTDTGTGIPKDKLRVIFKSFEQVNTSLNRKCEGSGVGLALVQAFMSVHEGRVYAESQLGKGSKFILEFPIQVIEGEPVRMILNNISSEKSLMEFADIY